MMTKKIGLLVAAVFVVFTWSAELTMAQSTLVPGHTKKKWDVDLNGYPDAGITTTGKYESQYAYDQYGDWYWDLGDGRVYQSRVEIQSAADLDQASLTDCGYQNTYRGQFNNDAFLDNGWIMNNITCTGVEAGVYKYTMVHQTDPRYTGNPDWALWGTWEYTVLVESGNGNLVHTLAAHLASASSPSGTN